MTTKAFKRTLLIGAMTLIGIYLLPSNTSTPERISFASTADDDETIPEPGGLKKKLIFPKKVSGARSSEAAAAYLRLYD